MSFFDGVRGADSVRALLPAVQLQAFSDGTRHYYQFSRKPVVHSRQLEPLVIADYAGDGSVRGIEFLDGVHGTLEGYIGIAIRVGQSIGGFGDGGGAGRVADIFGGGGGSGRVAHGSGGGGGSGRVMHDFHYRGLDLATQGILIGLLRSLNIYAWDWDTSLARHGFLPAVQ